MRDLTAAGSFKHRTDDKNCLCSLYSYITRLCGILDSDWPVVAFCGQISLYNDG